MAKILMIQVQSAPYAGTAYLNGAALSAGHEFVLYLGTDIKKINERINEENPDIIGLSCLSCFYSLTLDITKAIKEKFSIPIILGGPHPTFCPEVIYEPSIDMVCCGEGEFALADLLNAFENKVDYSNIKNLWVKCGEKIFQNELRPLIDPLDNAPLINWSCYEKTAIKNSSPVVFPIRGCPYSCSYCFNEKTRELYRDLGKYVRCFSVARTILEIKEALKFFAGGAVLFTSDTFGIDTEWMDNLFNEYYKITDRPFVLLLRPELVSEKCVEILSKYKCYGVAIGVESGSERVRNEVLNRHYSNSQLEKIAKMLHGKGIKFRTYNMIGLPTETEEELWETVDMNIKMKTDFPRGAVFTPFPGTKIVDLCKEKGYLDGSFSFSDIPKTILSNTILKNVDSDRIKNSLYFFQTAIIFPQIRNLAKKMTKWPPNILFRMWFYAVYVCLHRKSEQRSIISYINYLWANRRFK